MDSSSQDYPGLVASRNEDMLCLQCGYALRGLSRPICPECATEFDPLDESSFRRRGRRKLLGRVGLDSSVRHIYALAVVAFVFTVGLSVPGGASFWACMLAPSGIILSIYTIVRYLARVYLVKSTDHDDRLRAARLKWRNWIVEPLVLLWFVSLFFYPWPLRIRFALSMSSPAAFASQYTPGDESPGWIGLYHVEQVLLKEGGVFFKTDMDFIEPVGFLFHPNDRWRNLKRPWPRHLYRLAPNWYLWSD